jgi:hypothetical protein
LLQLGEIQPTLISNSSNVLGRLVNPAAIAGVGPVYRLCQPFVVASNKSGTREIYILWGILMEKSN